ncbi:kinase-like domain-containing protein [Rhizophagus clarus]|uniref:Kinase-like domain-containing protein n=1 Tax=Rhizophagus clarus TaxID=94130 RepID=A0A8H3QGN5_9GLOM|nr:kinase-like domain-containing protein [Rhizophagus clarus]
MSDIREKLVSDALNRTILLIDLNIYDNFHKVHEFRKQTILADKSLTNDEKSYAIKDLSGFSNIYTADWIDGRYEEWDFKEQKLIRFGEQKVAKSHFNISNKWSQIVPCFGLTQNPLNGSYMLVINIMDTDLRKYLQQNQLTWEERIKIAYDISLALNIIHSEAPEVISGKNTTKESDVYSIAMLMWEISSGQPPFNDYENDYNLALKIINGMRPKVVPGTPLKYENLMKQCWDAVPSKRLDITTLAVEFRKLLQSYQDNNDILNESPKLKTHNENSPITNYTSSKLFTSKIYEFKNLTEPRNATEEEQEAFHSKSYDCFNIPDNIDDFNNSSNQNYGTTSKASSILKELSNSFNELQVNSNEDNQINYGKEIVEQQQINKYHNAKIDDYEIYDDKNFHSEEQDEIGIPDGGF